MRKTLIHAAATPIQSAIKLFREEFEQGYTTPANELFPYAASAVFEAGA